jgi:GT2 family glycosyltransferase/glycosyltransferase involved in cell wall biosynthesis
MVKDRKQYRLIKRSRLFDKAYYLLTYPDVRQADINPLMHFIKKGWKEGRNPSSTFNTQDYLEQHPDLLDSGMNPLIHYIQRYQIEYQSIFSKLIKQLKYLRQYLQIKRSGLFDAEYYLETYPDVRKADVDPLMHFVKIGWKEGRNPTPTFLTQLYLDFNLDVAYEGVNPLIHYIKTGNKEGRVSKYYQIEDDKIRYFELSSHEARMRCLEFNASHPPTSIDIIIFPIINWDFRFQRPQQLACQLADRGHRVFYINTNFLSHRAPFIKTIRENVFSVQLTTRDPRLEINTFLSDENVHDLAESIRLLKDHFLINSAIMMVDLPFWRKLTLHLKELYQWKLVYDMMDFFLEFSNRSPYAEIDEKHLLRESDLVLASSDLLFTFAAKNNPHTLLLKNGTDFFHFNQASHPIDIKHLKKFVHPMIGYYGAIADWFDTKRVAVLAQAHPEWTFILIGDTELADLEPFDGLKNVHLLGEKPYSEIPGFLSHFDVCIIPFKQIPLTQATNPVKLYEYLSAGKPVVATRLNELLNYEAYIKLAETTQEWEAAIEECLAEEKTPELLQTRIEFAKANTWNQRVEILKGELLSLFPPVSIIVISFNNLDYTKLCLESICKHTSYPNYEIIIVDNGSDQDTIAYLKHFQSNHGKTSLVLNQNNEGFSKANNQGFRKSKGEYILFLNNDTIVTPGWMDRLLFHLRRDPSAGMVGPVTNSIGNEAKIDVPYQDLSDINLFAAHWSKNHTGQNFKIKVLALYCAIISRDLFTKVGGLDERYEIGFYEDDDLAMKINQLGLHLICAEDVFIHHFHGVSFKLLGDDKYQEILRENRKKFEDKWGIKWQQHRHRM